MKFEYRVAAPPNGLNADTMVNSMLSEWLNGLQEIGWKLQSVDRGRFYFVREVRNGRSLGDAIGEYLHPEGRQKGGGV